jgi:pimeloyl-ACP methyl ester carboxylesterase
MKKLKRIFLLMLLVILLAGTYWGVQFYSNNPETQTMNEAARKNADGQFIRLSGGITHYQSGGADTGKTVILVHGFSVPYYIWDGTYDSLVKQGFHVIRYDEFGRGFSDRPHVTYTPAFYRAQLLDLIALLHLKTPVHMAGVSFGGAVVADFAVHFPEMVDKIILADPAYPFANSTEPEMVADYKMALNHEKQAAGQLEDFKYPEKFPNWVSRYKVQMQYKGFRHALLSTRKNYLRDTIVSNYHKLGRLNKKILLIWGKDDQTVPFQYSDSIKNQVKADFFPVEDARHLPFLERPELVNPKIVSFLAAL